jgi:hypothetical protein
MLRRLVRSTLGLLAATAIFVLTLEALLTVWPTLLPPSLGNHAYSKYGTFPGGIYFRDLESKMHFMRSNFETRAYFNGYRWTHRTDHLGFRNPPELADRSLLLLGDSMIYGHGVEEESSVAHLLRTEFSRPAYNMARQGDCLWQSYILLRLNLDALDAETVVLFVFLNDFADAEIYRSAAQLKSPPEIDWDYDLMRNRLLEREAHTVLSPKRVLLGFKSIRLLKGAWRDMAPVSLISAAEAASGPIESSGFFDPILDPERFQRVSRYYRTLLRDLDHRLDQRGINLLVVHLNMGPIFGSRGERARRRLELKLQDMTSELGIAYASTADTFIDCSDCFLPNDGHLSLSGNRRLAGFVDSVLGATDNHDGEAPY